MRQACILVRQARLQRVQVGADLLDHGLHFLVCLALALAALRLRVNELASGSDGHLEITSRALVPFPDYLNLARESVFQRYCERIEVALLARVWKMQEKDGVSGNSGIATTMIYNHLISSSTTILDNYFHR